MNAIIIPLVLAIAFNLPLQSLASVPECCAGKNAISLETNNCENGSSVQLECPGGAYLHDPEEDFYSTTIDTHSNLIVGQAITPINQYCLTSLNDSVIYMVCFNEDMETAFLPNAILELISVIFLGITILVYLSVPDLLDLQGICIVHSISGLSCAFFALAIPHLISVQMPDIVCLTFAYVLYFSMFYAFFWLNLICFHIWRTIVKPNILSNVKQWLLVYHCIGILGPTILLFLLAIANHSSLLEESKYHPGLAENSCWFNSVQTQYVYFYTPMAVVLGINIIYFIWTLTVLWRDVQNTTTQSNKTAKYRFLICLKLFIIMGIPWIFELLSAVFQYNSNIPQTVWAITDYLNAIQGVFIFLVLVVFRKRVLRGLANRSFCGMRLPGNWRNLPHDESEKREEAMSLSETKI